jgi:hypothetical protein
MAFNSMINFEFKYDAQKTMNLYSQSTRYSKRSWKKYCFELFIFMMTVVPLTPNEPKLLKQVQNFYFLQELLRYFMVMKAPVL